jgi:hypothetical protein
MAIEGRWTESRFDWVGLLGLATRWCGWSLIVVGSLFLVARSATQRYLKSSVDLWRRGCCPECGYSLRDVRGRRCPECSCDADEHVATRSRGAKGGVPRFHAPAEVCTGGTESDSD